MAVCLRECVLVGRVNCHISAHIKWDKQTNYIGSYAGSAKTEDRDKKEQIKSESRTEEDRKDKVLTVGVFEST